MGDLIDRDKLLDSLPKNDTVLSLDVRRIVLDAPAVDAAPVMRKHCDFCGRGKPIKAFTTLPDCGLQYGTSIMATYCPNCGAKLEWEGEAK